MIGQDETQKPSSFVIRGQTWLYGRVGSVCWADPCKISNMRRWRRWSGNSLGHRSGCLERCLAVPKCHWTMRTKTGRLLRLTSSTLILDDQRKLFQLMIRRRAWSPCHVIVSNGCPCSPWKRLLLSRSRHKNFELGPCNTPVILDISHWKTPRPEDRTAFSIIAERILVGKPLCYEMVICIEQRPTATDQDKCTTLLSGNWETRHSRERRLAGTVQK